MGGGACIGGMVEETGLPVRPLPVKGFCHAPEVAFNVGEVWSMHLRRREPVEAPHVEDHDEWGAVRAGVKDGLLAFITRHGQPHDGDVEELFGRTLVVRSSGTAYLPRSSPAPAWSVEFWRPPRPLEHHSDRDGRPRYTLLGGSCLRIPYVGYEAPVAFIPAGTILRLSLARWWVNPQAPEEGESCSLQLSGWFGLPAATQPMPARQRSTPLKIAEEDIPY
jgi:ATP-dependent DNA helicase RecQ